MLTDNSALFSWLNMLAMTGWVLLILAPKRWNWLLIITGLVIPCVIAMVYGGLMLTHMSAVEGGGYSNLIQVKALMNNEPILLAGWAHYLSFDLLIGTIIAKESDKAGIVRMVQIPMLLGTFMYGPVGLLLFVVTLGFCKLAAHTAPGQLPHPNQKQTQTQTLEGTL